MVYTVRPDQSSEARLADAWEEISMTTLYKVGDHVSWNSEAGPVMGRIIRVHTSDFDYKGYTHHASPEDPQYEIRSDRSDHIAAHKGTALRLVDGEDR
jgi:hypothetical protein